MFILNNRLLAVASFIEKGSFVADIGTDHAYLPIWLLLNSIVSKVIASDNKAGPLNKAKQNIESYGLSGKIKLINTDGLCGIETFSPDTVVIAGMGGELIRDIIKKSPFVIRDHVKLILQPMTRAHVLRRYLYDNCFNITGEKLACDDRIYEIICSEYDGAKQIYSRVELLVGKKNIEERAELLCRHIDRHLDVLKHKTEGYKRASLDASDDLMLNDELLKLKEML